MMKRWFAVMAVAALALTLADAGTSHAQRFGRGGWGGGNWGTGNWGTGNWGGWGWGGNTAWGGYGPSYGYNYGSSPYGMGASTPIGAGYNVSGYWPNTYGYGNYASWPNTYSYNPANYGMSPYYYGNTMAYGTPTYTGGTTVYSPSSYAMMPQNYVSFYPPNFPQGSPAVGSTTGFSQANPNQAMIEVRVPDNAQVWFDGDATQQRGADRLFSSPPLEPGKRYHYDVKARWHEGDRTVEKTRTVHVEAGKHVTVEFGGAGSDRDRDLDRDRTLDRDLDRTPDRTRDRDLDRTPDRTRDRNLDRTPDRTNRTPDRTNRTPDRNPER
jgi:uncharacterized protein (TIGR03000 family)